MNLTKISIVEALKGLKSKQFSSVELTNAHLDQMEKAKSLNAYVVVTKEQGLDMAKAADSRIAKGEMRKLDGIPVGVKDLFCTKNVRTTSCSGILRNFVPPYESTVTAKMWDAGAVMLGKLNMDELAMGSSNKTSYFGPVVNPLLSKDSDKKFVPGGSSGGSAAAVSGFMAMGAFASDTGGSIRQPAAYTGLVGIKPTYGRCSRFGMIAFASSLDQAGMMARSVEDSALLMETIMGYDEKDSTSVKMEVPNLSGNINKNMKGMRIGIPKEYYNDKLDPEIHKSWQQTAKWLEEAGAELVEISLPHTKYALPVYYIIAPAEASSNLSRYDGVRFGYRAEGEFSSLDEMYELTRTEGFGEEVKRRIMIGTYVLSAGYYDAYYKKAQRVRALIAKDFKDNFDNKIDAIITPTTPSTAFGIDDIITDPVTMYLNDIFTIPASLAGLPAMSVPVGVASNGMPIGIHIISKPFREDIAINVAASIEEKAEFDKIEKRYIYE